MENLADRMKEAVNDAVIDPRVPISDSLRIAARLVPPVERTRENTDSRPGIAIVGAGWAGMAAAVTLASRDAPVSVFEASRFLGGRARHVTMEGRILDNGQHILIGAYTETLRMMRAVGVDPAAAFVRMPLNLTVMPEFSLRAWPLPGPLGLAAGLLGARGLSFADRLAVARFIRRAQKNEFRLARDCTVRQLLDEHEQSADACRYLWNPLCIAALNTTPNRASARVFLNVLRDSIGAGGRATDLLLPRFDLTALFPEPAARYVRERGGAIHLGRSIRRISRHADGWQLDDQTERYRAVILACAPQHAAPLIAPFAELAAERGALQSFAYEPILTCYLEYSPLFRLPQPMIGLARGMVQWVFDRGQLGGPPGLIAAVTSAGRGYDEARLPELALRAGKEVATAFPEAAAPRWLRVIAERRATFACTPDLVRPANRTLVPGLLFAGDYTAGDYPATLESAIRSGVQAGQLALDVDLPSAVRRPEMLGAARV